MDRRHIKSCLGVIGLIVLALSFSSAYVQNVFNHRVQEQYSFTIIQPKKSDQWNGNSSLEKLNKAYVHMFEFNHADGVVGYNLTDMSVVAATGPYHPAIAASMTSNSNCLTLTDKCHFKGNVPLRVKYIYSPNKIFNVLGSIDYYPCKSQFDVTFVLPLGREPETRYIFHLTDIKDPVPQPSVTATPCH